MVIISVLCVCLLSYLITPVDSCCSSTINGKCCEGSIVRTCFAGTVISSSTCTLPEVCNPIAVPPQCYEPTEQKPCSPINSPICDGDKAAYCDSDGKQTVENSVDCSILGQSCVDGECVGDVSESCSPNNEFVCINGGDSQAFCFQGKPTSAINCTNGTCQEEVGKCNVTNPTNPDSTEESCFTKPNGCLDSNTMYYCSVGQKIPVSCDDAELGLGTECVDGKCELLPGGSGESCAYMFKRYCVENTMVQCVNYKNEFELDCGVAFMSCEAGMCEQASLFQGSSDTTTQKAVSTDEYKGRIETIMGWITGGFGIFTIVCCVCSVVTFLTIIGIPISLCSSLCCCLGCCLLVLAAIFWPIAYTLIPKVSYDELTMKNADFQPFSTLSLQLQFKYTVYITNDAYYDITVEKLNVNVRKFGRLLATATGKYENSKIKAGKKSPYEVDVEIKLSLFDISEGLEVYKEFSDIGYVIFDIDGDASGDYIGYEWSKELYQEEKVVS